MALKICFTSCADQINDPVQRGWTFISGKSADILLLLGDQIYMDYGFGNGHMSLGMPRSLSLREFSEAMYRRYRAQYEVPSFRQAISRPTTYAIWDDHDFAWNNARGGASSNGGTTSGHDVVPPDKRLLSRALFQQFRETLVAKPAKYPPNPVTNGIVTEDLGGIQSTVNCSHLVRLHLLDGRSFRERPASGGTHLGLHQRENLERALISPPGINIIVSSTTLKDWKKYSDYRWLRDWGRTHRILVLSGDIHEPDFRIHETVFEATASAIAQPPGVTAILGKQSEVFGVLSIDDSSIEVEIYAADRRDEHYEIDRARWSCNAM
ncbi:MAG: alkaline phosphatase D family protein [Burkholderiales bacterium]|nr:alkaline phosphatase D family protein [Burkholderiales bacterium]